MKVAIGIPLQNTVPSRFFINFINRLFEWEKKSFGIELIMNTDYPLDRVRCDIARVALEKDCDYLFFLDSDVIIRPNYLEHLIDHDKDIISCLYQVKTRPYMPLMKKQVSPYLYLTILDGDGLVEVDGCGLGACLINTDVFRKLPMPWFKNEWHLSEAANEWSVLGEDLYFFKLARQYGYKVYVDTDLKCEHIGTPVTWDMYTPFKDEVAQLHKERDSVVRELEEYYNMKAWDIYPKLVDAQYLVNDEYKSMPPDIKKDWYKYSKNYIYYLINHHMTTGRLFDLQLIEEVKRHNPKSILDFGSGIGQNAIMLAERGYNVSMMDIDSITADFARYRVKKRGLNIPWYPMMKIDKKFDLILCIDVMEYVPDDQFPQVIELLKSLRAEDGKIFIVTNFGHRNKYPMRYESSDEKMRLLEDLINA